MNNIQKNFKHKAKSGIRCMAGGGMVEGPGGETEDKVPAWLSDEEAVLPAKTVRAIGGPEAVHDLIEGTTGKRPASGLREGGKYAGGYVDDDEIQAVAAGVRSGVGNVASTTAYNAQLAAWNKANPVPALPQSVGAQGAQDAWEKTQQAKPTAQPVHTSRPAPEPGRWNAVKDTVARGLDAAKGKFASAPDPLVGTARPVQPGFVQSVAQGMPGAKGAEQVAKVAATGLSKLATGAIKVAGPLAVANDASRVVNTIADPTKTKLDVAKQGGRQLGKWAGAGIGAQTGAAIGGFGGPFAPVTVPVGAAIGGGLGYFGADKLLPGEDANSVVDYVLNDPSPADKARGVGAQSSLADTLDAHEAVMNGTSTTKFDRSKLVTPISEGDRLFAASQVKTLAPLVARQKEYAANPTSVPAAANAVGVAVDPAQAAAAKSEAESQAARDGWMAERGIRVDRSAPKLSMAQANGLSRQSAGLGEQQRLDYGPNDEVYGSSNRKDGKLNNFTGIGNGQSSVSDERYNFAMQQAADNRAKLEGIMLAKAGSTYAVDKGDAQDWAAQTGPEMVAKVEQAGLRAAAMRRDPVGVYKQGIESGGRAADRRSALMLAHQDRQDALALRKDALDVARGTAAAARENHQDTRHDALTKQNMDLVNNAASVGSSDGKTPDPAKVESILKYINSTGKDIGALDQPTVQTLLRGHAAANRAKPFGDSVLRIVGLGAPDISTVQDGRVVNRKDSWRGSQIQLGDDKGPWVSERERVGRGLLGGGGDNQEQRDVDEQLGLVEQARRKAKGGV